MQHHPLLALTLVALTILQSGCLNSDSGVAAVDGTANGDSMAAETSDGGTDVTTDGASSDSIPSTSDIKTDENDAPPLEGDGGTEDVEENEDTSLDPQDIANVPDLDADDDSGPMLPPDQDEDGIPDEEDNCPMQANPGQDDTDDDGFGDVCDPLTDSDGDGSGDDVDNCPDLPNPDQEDLDMDGIGDACDPLVDTDGDGVGDDDDNCPWDPNPTQADWNANGEGDACDPMPDTDGDGIPDPADPEPENANMPGVALAQTVYAHTAKKLYTMDVKSYAITEIGNFKWPADGGGHQMTDIAIDQYGIFYGVTFDRLYRCHPQTADCQLLGKLPQSFNGLTVVPAGTVKPDEETLIGVSNSGYWLQLDVDGEQVTQTNLGKYDDGYTSSGDAYSIVGSGTYAAVNKAGDNPDFLIQIDPTNGSLVKEIGPITNANKNYSSVYGLAGWTARAFAFDASGDVLVIEIDNANVMKVADTNISWWGAGVRTTP